MPSTRKILRSASNAPEYFTAPPFMPVTCIFRRSTSKGYVNVCDIVPKVIMSSSNTVTIQEKYSPANAPQLNFLTIVFFPGGVRMPLKNSYAAKLIPTYGATPTAVVTNPRYSPRTPPSSRIILSVIPHIVKSAFLYTVAITADADAVV
jgi:hypothetical protein